MERGRHVVLGVSGGVAAYKAAYLARLLIERGADVRVVMTESATAFVGEATFAALTGTKPVTDLFADDDVSPHTTLGRWADVIVIAPATAATLSRLATGASSDALVATVFASTAPVIVAPAMHTEMWEQPAVRANVERLHEYGYTVVGPVEGRLAGDDTGMGRMAEPDHIASYVMQPDIRQDMTGLSVLVTAGGTREPIDPVRFVGNRSSGKMGNAIAEVAAMRGARVVLVTTQGVAPSPEIQAIQVETAEEMRAAVAGSLPGIDVAVMAAAVADFRPEIASESKLSRADGAPTVAWTSTPDILASIRDSDHKPFLVGFAAQVGSLEAATNKAIAKGTDLLVANDVSKPGSGFGSDTNEVRFIYPDGTAEDLPLKTKHGVADAMWNTVNRIRSAR